MYITDVIYVSLATEPSYYVGFPYIYISRELTGAS